MVIALVNANRGLTSTAAGGFNPTITLTTGASIAVGNTLILTASYDNSGTAGVDPDMFVVSSSVLATQFYYQDLRGNAWYRIAKVVRSSGGANDGAVADIWACLVTYPFLNGDLLTLQFSFSVAGLNALVSEYSGLNARSYSVVTAVSSTGNGTTIGPAATITPTVIGQMVVGVAAVEDDVVITGDGDSTGGTWSTLGQFGIGAGATGNSIMSQYKIVTTTAAQDWKVTKTGASDWAALAVVFEAFTNVPSPFTSGNPNYTCIAGAEILPLDFDDLPVDTGTEYLQTHQVFPNSYGTQQYQAACDEAFKPMGSGATYGHHTTIHEVYLSGSENVIDPTVSATMVVLAAGVGSGASVSSGTAADALLNVGGAYVTLPAGGFVDVLFDPALLTLFPNYRVVNWSVQYLAWKDDGVAPGPGEGMIIEWRDSLASNGAGSAATISAWLVQNLKRDAQFQTRSLGETNPIIRGKGEILAQNAPYNAAFTINDLSHMQNADQTTRLRIYGAAGNDPSQTTVYLDYITAFAQIVPERRLAHGTKLVSNSPTFATSAYFVPGISNTPMWSALNTNNPWQVPAAANTYVLATREAQPASPADYYANLASTASGSIGRSVGWNESLGPSFLLRAITQPRATLENAALTGQPILRRGVINGGLLAATPENLDNYVISVAPVDRIRLGIDGSFFPAYDFGGVEGSLSEVSTGAPITAQVKVPGAVAYNRVKLLIYPDELTTANLTVTIEQPALTVLATATLTPATALAFPDLGNSWREISLLLNTPVTPAAGQVVIRLASTTPATAPWRISRANPIGGLDAFSYDYSTNEGDTAAVLQCTLAVPTVVVGTATQSLYRPNGRCVLSSVSLPTLTLSNGATYSSVAIERSTDAGATYSPAALIDSPTNGQIYTDAAAPWDLPSATITYRVTGYRDSDHQAVQTVTAGWAGTVTAPGVAFGLAVNSTLYAYVPVDESEMRVEWSPLNPVEIVPLLGVDYQIPLRAPEERGLQVSFLVLVDQLGVCADTDTVPWSEVLAPGGQSMSPTPFAQLRTLAGDERLALLLPGGYTRWVTITLGKLSIRTQGGLFLSDMTLTDITPPSIDPYAAGS